MLQNAKNLVRNNSSLQPNTTAHLAVGIETAKLGLQLDIPLGRLVAWPPVLAKRVCVCVLKTPWKKENRQKLIGWGLSITRHTHVIII